ncbi:OB-fold nucleic acid binding domain-containing protein, partial [Salinibacterium sp.]|uniref:OB-fold nucleic acid binding domain-containing protein n=1 Tax=Salinibacterium sp. TaxID=1915057 RepID=UPI0037CA8650
MTGSVAVVASPLDQKLSVALGERTAAAFSKGLGLITVGDLLSHYPRRYARRGELTELTHLPIDENVTIVAEVLRVMNRPMRAKRGSILEVTIGDGLGILTLTFFNQAWRANELTPGARGIFAGKVGDYRGSLQLAHPDYELFDETGVDAAGGGNAGGDVGDGAASRAGGGGNAGGDVGDAAAGSGDGVAAAAAAAGAGDGVAAGAAADSAGAERAKAWAELPIPLYPATSTVASWQIQKAV